MVEKPGRNAMTYIELIFSLFLYMAVPVVAGDEEPDIGKIKFIEGTARKQVSGSDGWLTIEDGMTSAIGDSVKTLEDARLEIQLEGNGVFRVGGSSTVFVAGDQGRRLAIPELVSGDIWADFQHRKNEDFGSSPRMILPTIEILTDSSSARFMSGNDCTSEIKVYSGRLEVTRREPRGGPAENDGKKGKLRPCDEDQSASDSLFSKWSVELEAGQRLIISSKGQIVHQGAFGPDDPDESTEWVRWNKEKDQIK